MADLTIPQLSEILIKMLPKHEYFVRVELHDLSGAVSYETYNKLHDAMETGGYSKERAGLGNIDALPTATYYKKTHLAPQFLEEEVWGIVSKIHKPATILTMKVGDALLNRFT